MRRRVVVLTNLFPFPEDRTRGIFNLQQFESLAEHHDLLVVVPVPFMQWKPHYASVRSMGRLKVRYFRFFYPPGFARSLHEGFLWRSLRLQSFTEIKLFSPHCMVGCWLYPDGVTAARIARVLGIPLVLKAHGTDVNQPWRAGMTGRRLRAAVADASSLVLVSRALAQRAAEIGLDVTRAEVIYNGVASDRFSPRDRAECRRVLGLSPADRLLLFVGNLKSAKGCVDFLSAAPAVLRAQPTAKFCFVGSGVAEQALRTLADRLGVTAALVLAGRQQHEKIVTWMGASDLVALPSHAEGVPNVLLEAMACGRPVVATNVGGIPEIVGPSSGRLVPPHDPDALSAALIEVLETVWSPNSIRDSVMQFTWQQSGRSLARVIETAAVNCAR